MMLHLTDQLLFVRSKLDHQCAKRPVALEYKQTYSQASLIVRTGSEKNKT
jgi:regulation of enolase protein 1 (concanavalin A-like superfamily)